MMNHLAIAGLLGVVEGFTEFFPISSSAHVYLLASWLGLPAEQAKIFNILMQAPAISAVFFFYWAFWARLVLMCVRDPRQAAGRLLVMGCAIVPIGLGGVCLSPVIHTAFFSPVVIATALIVGGGVLIWLEQLARTIRCQSVDQISWDQALRIGGIQMLALCPGVSRSGATIVGGVLCGLSRPVAVEFSFLIAVPVSFLASGYELWKCHAAIHPDAYLFYSVGAVATFVSALSCIRALLFCVQWYSLAIFGWYRIILGSIILIMGYCGYA